MKAGKSFVFWGLDNRYNAVSVVGLGEKTPKSDENELICQEKEAIRVAAAGKHLQKFISFVKTFFFQSVARV